MRRGASWSGPVTWSAPATARQETPAQTPLAYTPPYLAEKILTSRSVLEGERKQVTVLFADLKDSTELSGASIPKPPSSSSIPLPSHDGRRAPLRGHGQPGAGRWHYGPVWGPHCPRRPRPTRLLCRPGHAGGDARLYGGGPPHPGPGTAPARRPQLRRSGGARHWQRPAHGLLGGGGDHGPGGAHGTDGHAGSTRLTPATLRLVEGLVQVTPWGLSPSKGSGSRWRCSSWSVPAASDGACRPPRRGA